MLPPAERGVRAQSGAADLLYSTYLGGSGDDWASALAVDGAGNAYVAGQTFSPDFPTTAGASDRTVGFRDAFVATLALGPYEAPPPPPTVTFTPAVVPPGGVITISGSGFSTSTATATVRLVDSIVTTSTVATLGTAPLSNGASNAVPFTLPASVAPGVYRLQATDGIVTATSVATLTVQAALPDLIIEHVSAGPAVVGQSIPLTITVRNIGPVGTSSGYHVHLFADRTTPPTPTDLDTVLHMATDFGPLAAGAAQTVVTSLGPTVLSAGAHTLWALADGHDTIVEANEANNTAVITLTVLSAPPPAGGVRLFVAPPEVGIGVGQTVAVTVTLDAGPTPVDAVDVRLAFSPTVLAAVDADPGTPGIQAVPGPRLPQVRTNTVNAAAGTITFAAGIRPGQTPVTGTIPVAMLIFSTTALGSSALVFLPGTEVAGGGNILPVVLDPGRVEVLGARLVLARAPIRAAHGILFGCPLPGTPGVCHQPQVVLVDAQGLTLTVDSTTVVTLSLKPGTGAPGAVLTCDHMQGGVTSTQVLTGTATFSGCQIDRPGVGYVLVAEAAGFGLVESRPFNVTWHGDGTADGRVSAVDYSLVVTHYGKTQASPDWRDAVRQPWRVDLDGDERVFVEDYSLVVSFYGTTGPPVPPSDTAVSP